MKRIVYVDYLKALGIIGVIIIHLSSKYLTETQFLSPIWIQGVAVESFVRFSIILFVMASGVLLLRKKQTVEDLPRRLKRVLLPYLFWFIIYFIVKMVKVHGISYMLSISNTLNLLITALADPTILSVQFWFVYMIVGVYLVSPIISTWIEHAKRSEIRYFLAIWFALIIISMVEFRFILVEYLNCFMGFVGYFILGHYLHNTKNVYLRSPRVGLLLYLLGVVITLLGFILTSYLAGSNNYTFIKLGDLTLNSALQATGMFIILKNMDYTKVFGRFESKITKLATYLSILSFGIYLSNILLINLFFKFGFYNVAVSPFINVPIFTIITILLCSIMLLILNKIPYLNKITGIT